METPYTKHRSAQYRGPTTSDDYNARIEEAYQDLVILYNRARLSDLEIDELYRRMVKDQYEISRVVSDLEARIESLEAAENRATFFSPDQVMSDNSPTPNPLGDSQFGIDEVDRLTLDARHGLLLLPRISTSSVSKVRFTSADGLELPPPGLEIRVVGKAGTADGVAATVDTSNPEFALYRKPGLIWERNVIAESPHVDGAEMEFFMRVPVEMFTTNQSNVIAIHPFPYFGVTIKEVLYSTTVDPLLRDSDGYSPVNEAGHYEGETEAIGWVAPGGWSGAEEGNDAIVDAGPRYFVFPPKEVTAIKLVLKQESYYEEAAKFIYTYGLSRLDVRYDKFLPEGRALIQFDAPDGNTISSVNSVQPQMWNVSPARLTEMFWHRVIWETSPGSGVYTLTPQPNSERVWIEVNLSNDEGWSPALSGLVVEYS